MTFTSSSLDRALAEGGGEGLGADRPELVATEVEDAEQGRGTTTQAIAKRLHACVAEAVVEEAESLQLRQTICAEDHSKRRHMISGEAFAYPVQPGRHTQLREAARAIPRANLAAQRHSPRMPLLQHLERRQQRRPQPEAGAAERDGDDGLERVGEAVEDHAQLVVAQREQEAARGVVAAAAARGGLAASRARRARRQTRACTPMHGFCRIETLVNKSNS